MSTVIHKPRIAIVGTFQVGKSTLMNCLLADDVAKQSMVFCPATGEIVLNMV